mgnify:CR=1 FL=1
MVSKTFPKCVKIRSNPRIFNCVICDYKCCRRSDMKNHINSKKHMLKFVAIESIKSAKNSFSCQYCDKSYKTRSGLWKHEKKCDLSSSTELFPSVSKNSENSVLEEELSENDEKDMEEYYKDKYQKKYIKQLETIIQNGTLGGSHNTSNSHNNSNNTNNISINVFLNDHCKDAKSIQDFVDNIKFKLTDFFDGQLPIKDSVSNVVVKQLNDMPTTERPIHCMDNRRGNFMVKDKDEGWVQDKGDMLANNIKRVQQKALLQSYDTFDAEYVPPHPGRIQDKKDAIVNPIRNGLQKDTSKIIKEVASVTNIKDAMKSLQDKK